MQWNKAYFWSGGFYRKEKTIDSLFFAEFLDLTTSDVLMCSYLNEIDLLKKHIYKKYMAL